MASRLIAVIIGITMMARIIPAARKPTPNGGPWNNGRNPSLLPSQLSMGFLTNGTSTNNPHNPIITLGMAASISMTKEAGPLNHDGDSSVRKIAAPRLIGTAISKPITALNNVPKIAGKAPNITRTASQDELLIKENPNLSIAGMAFTARTITMLKRMSDDYHGKNQC